MYYCRVLTGESINGNSSMRVPPCKKSGTHLLYDTTTDNSLRPSMFIIYHDSQAVADYLITFKSWTVSANPTDLIFLVPTLKSIDNFLTSIIKACQLVSKTNQPITFEKILKKFCQPTDFWFL